MSAFHMFSPPAAGNSSRPAYIEAAVVARRRAWELLGSLCLVYPTCCMLHDACCVLYAVSISLLNNWWDLESTRIYTS